MRLTAAGVRLLSHARSIERDFHLAEAVGRQGASPPAPLRLGVLASIATDSIAAFAARYAGARPLELIEGSDADLRRRLADHRLDAALTLLREGEPHDVLLEEGYAMLVSDRHPLAGRAELAPEDVAGAVLMVAGKWRTQRGLWKLGESVSEPYLLEGFGLPEREGPRSFRRTVTRSNG